MDFDLLGTLQYLVRWTHVFAAILWIGQTYLFNFMEDRLESADGDDVIIGKLWMVHGGGLFRVEKQRYASYLPPVLHWFKYEAAATWLSGIVLITLVYYVDGLLITPDQDFLTAALVGGFSLPVGWLLYDGLVRSPLGRRPVLFAAIGLVLIMALHYGYLQVMSPRSAFIHVGAVLGSIMTANVWERILPSTEKQLAAIRSGTPVSVDVASTGPLRSRQNSYVVMPVVAIMISNHYPSVSYGNEHSTLVLGVLVVLGWGIARLFRKPLFGRGAAHE
ncbi:MAG: urate hydroxylase PuuD [Rhodothermales bacterium]|nr:urate hydroxylase PuuD [Rhodothermales bacterium]MBO6778638.1 urate hydroxylase PuuD [Rhodothermales bacterium]